MTEVNPAPAESSPPEKTTNQFGTFGGVFTPSMLTILGVILFMRSGYVTGQAGIGSAMLVLALATQRPAADAVDRADQAEPRRLRMAEKASRLRELCAASSPDS